MDSESNATAQRPSTTQSVGLSIGSVIVIAFLIIVFGRTNTGPLEDKIDALQSEVSSLRSQIDELSAEVRSLRPSGLPERP